MPKRLAISPRAPSSPAVSASWPSVIFGSAGEHYRERVRFVLRAPAFFAPVRMAWAGVRSTWRSRRIATTKVVRPISHDVFFGLCRDAIVGSRRRLVYTSIAAYLRCSKKHLFPHLDAHFPLSSDHRCVPLRQWITAAAERAFDDVVVPVDTDDVPDALVIRRRYDSIAVHVHLLSVPDCLDRPAW